MNKKKYRRIFFNNLKKVKIFLEENKNKNEYNHEEFEKMIIKYVLLTKLGVKEINDYEKDKASEFEKYDLGYSQMYFMNLVIYAKRFIDHDAFFKILDKANSYDCNSEDFVLPF